MKHYWGNAALEIPIRPDSSRTDVSYNANGLGTIAGQAWYVQQLNERDDSKKKYQLNESGERGYK